MYNFFSIHDHKFWTILMIKDVQKIKFTTSIQNICIYKDQHILLFLSNVLKSTINLRTFGEGLNNKTHVHIF